jgi:hypothetical protein
VPSPVPSDYVPDNPGHVPIIHYCQFISVPKDGLPDNTGGPDGEKGQHLPGYSFGKYDYREGFDFAKQGRNLLKCGADATDIYMAAPSACSPLSRGKCGVGAAAPALRGESASEGGAVACHWQARGRGQLCLSGLGRGMWAASANPPWRVRPAKEGAGSVLRGSRPTRAINEC